MAKSLVIGPGQYTSRIYCPRPSRARVKQVVVSEPQNQTVVLKLAYQQELQ